MFTHALIKAIEISIEYVFLSGTMVTGPSDWTVSTSHHILS